MLHACYEASGAGYVLHRAFTSWGVHCDVIAPSMIPTKPGHQHKHDAYDAAQLARLYRALVPRRGTHRDSDSERGGGARARRGPRVVPRRETFQREILKSRHYILKFLTRRGFVYREGTNWRQPHYEWLRRLSHATSPLAPEDRQVFSEYLGLLEYTLSRRDELDRQIAELALTPAVAAAVQRLQCFRGLQVHGAMVLATELVDWRRFENPRQLMAYLGLVPRERSSGDRERRGSLTKAGNSHCRHVLVQAAWAYRFQPKIGVALKARQQGQSPVVIAHAWKAQHRLHTFYRRLAMRTRPQIAVVAVARELVGFLWAVMQEAPVHAAAA